MGMSKGPWFTSGGYKHLDVQIGASFAAKTESPDFVTVHAWSPLIKYIKRTKRYKPAKHGKAGKTIYKERPIMYASHRDACILKRYARTLTELLNAQYKGSALDTAVI